MQSETTQTTEDSTVSHTSTISSTDSAPIPTFLDGIPMLPSSKTCPTDLEFELPHPEIIWNPIAEYFSDALEAPVEAVANELDIFQDAQEYDWFEPSPASLVPPMDLWNPDAYVFTDNHMICAFRTAHYTTTRYVGGSEVYSDDYSPLDSGADTVFCGHNCVNEEIDDSRKVSVIGCHGSIDKPPYHIGTNLTTTTDSTGARILLRIPESIAVMVARPFLLPTRSAMPAMSSVTPLASTVVPNPFDCLMTPLFLCTTIADFANLKLPVQLPKKSKS